MAAQCDFCTKETAITVRIYGGGNVWRVCDWHCAMAVALKNVQEQNEHSIGLREQEIAELKAEIESQEFTIAHLRIDNFFC